MNQDDLKEFMKKEEIERGIPFNIITFIESAKKFLAQDISEEQYKLNKLLTSLAFDFCLNALKDFNITEKDGCLVTYLKE